MPRKSMKTKVQEIKKSLRKIDKSFHKWYEERGGATWDEQKKYLTKSYVEYHLLEEGEVRDFWKVFNHVTGSDYLALSNVGNTWDDNPFGQTDLVEFLMIAKLHSYF